MRLRVAIRVCALGLALILSTAAADKAQATFSSPEKAVTALLFAVESGNFLLFLRVAGSQMAGFWSTGDPERDVIERHRFLDTFHLRATTPGSGKVLYAGEGALNFPAPLIKTRAGWRFDGEAGSKEVAARRIRSDENAAMEFCQRFGEAEYAYFAMAPAGEHEFAARINGAAGKRDGLVWNGDGDGDESPLGPAFGAAALTEKRWPAVIKPLEGYYFKILAEQGPYAPGGAMDYREDGHMRNGFAIVAWPASYGSGGIHTFVMDQRGEIYQRDLGPATAGAARRMSAFDPGFGWNKVEPARPGSLKANLLSAFSSK
jgi:hypothetical protein